MTLEEEYMLSLYEELTRLQEGKDVWLVRHQESGQIYVKKNLSLYERDVYRQIQNLSLPVIPTIHCCVETEGHLIVIEEYIHGRSLEQIVQEEGPFGEERAIRIMLSLCEIVKQLHRLSPPVIHRDLKPSNILLSREGTVYLIDFNTARSYRAGGVQDTWLMGTREYAAPEQYGFGQSDHRTDIYGLGVTFNYMLTASVPKQRMAWEPFRTIVGRCTRLEPSERYQNVTELEQNLWNLLNEKYSPKRVIPSRRTVTKEERDSVQAREFTWRQFLPVGFRSGRAWKMIVAVMGYLSMYWMAFAGEFTSEGVPLTGLKLYLNQWAMFLLMLGYVVWGGNYLGIRSYFPKMESGGWRGWIMGALYLFLYSFVLLFLLVIIENILGI